MWRCRVLLAALVVALPTAATATDEVSIERGRLVSIIGGCHDCHTEGYSESEGVIDPAKALKGSRIGWRGPWGTTYAQDLRVRAHGLTEDGWVSYLKSLRTLPPMPWYNVRAMSENDLRSLYRYLKSFGDSGAETSTIPAFVPPGAEPRTPFVVMAPPQMPAPCTRDLDCGMGEVCSVEPPRKCIAR
jgi:hypothetical protein